MCNGTPPSVHGLRGVRVIVYFPNGALMDCVQLSAALMG